MAKNPRPDNPDDLPPLKPLPADGGMPEAPDPYPGSERFGDWDLTNIIPVDPGERLVNDDPTGDPNKIANQAVKPKK